MSSKNYNYKSLYIKYKQKYLNLKNLMKGGYFTKDEPDKIRNLEEDIIKKIRKKAEDKGESKSEAMKLFKGDNELLTSEELEKEVNQVFDFINVNIDPKDIRSIELMRNFCSLYPMPVSFPGIEEQFTNSQLLEFYISDPEKYKILKLWFHNKLNNKRLGAFIDSRYSTANREVPIIGYHREIIPQLNVILSLVEERIMLLRGIVLRRYLEENSLEIDDIFLNDEDAFIYTQFIKIYKESQ